MTLPLSGPLSLNDIRVELGASSTNVSLGTMSDTAGFTAPDKVSDFYGFSAVPTGLTSAIYTENLSSSNSWSLVQEDISTIYNGKTCKLVIHYTNGTASTSFRGDFQVGANISFGPSDISFASSMTGWETTRANVAGTKNAYDAATFFTLADGATSGRWNRRNTSAPPSGGTGLVPDTSVTGTQYYAYTETSGASSTMLGYGFFFRSPSVTLDSESNSFEIAIAHFGSNVGSFSVFLDVIS